MKAAAEPIDRPGHHHVELALSGIPAKPIELGALISALSATDAVIPVDAGDLTAHAAGHLSQLPLLVGRGLVSGGNPQVAQNMLISLGSQSRFCEEFFRTAQIRDFERARGRISGCTGARYLSFRLLSAR